MSFKRFFLTISFIFFVGSLTNLFAQTFSIKGDFLKIKGYNGIYYFKKESLLSVSIYAKDDALKIKVLVTTKKNEGSNELDFVLNTSIYSLDRFDSELEDVLSSITTIKEH